MEKLMSIHVNLGEPRTVGQTSEGLLTIIPITGGSFEGPQISGRVCMGGADWSTVANGIVHVCARYWLEAENGETIAIFNEGWFPSEGHEGAIKTHPRFMVDAGGNHTCLNTGVFLGELRGGVPGSVDIDIWEIKKSQQR